MYQGNPTITNEESNSQYFFKWQWHLLTLVFIIIATRTLSVKTPQYDSHITYIVITEIQLKVNFSLKSLYFITWHLPITCDRSTTLLSLGSVLSTTWLPVFSCLSFDRAVMATFGKHPCWIKHRPSATFSFPERSNVTCDYGKLVTCNNEDNLVAVITLGNNR